MTNRRIVTVVGGLGAFIIGAVIAIASSQIFRSGRKSSESTVNPTPQALESSPTLPVVSDETSPQAVLTLSSDVRDGERVLVMWIDSRGTQVQALETALTFDPQIVAITNVSSGAQFPILLSTQMDNREGVVSFQSAVGSSQAAVTGPAEVAIIHYNGTTDKPLIFDLPRTLVGASGRSIPFTVTEENL